MKLESTRIQSYIAQMGITLDDEQSGRFARYYELLVEWNAVMNLTAITDPEDVLIKHFADSLAPLAIGLSVDAAAAPEQLPTAAPATDAGSASGQRPPSGSAMDAAAPATDAGSGSGQFPPSGSAANAAPAQDKRLPLIGCDASAAPPTLLDIGTGAGFPAIPLKIACPALQVTMIDSLAKRVRFLEEAITVLGLSGIHAMHGRAEDYAHDPAHRGRYDFVVSRAVANMSTLSEYCLPYVRQATTPADGDECLPAPRPYGYFIAYKSSEYLDGPESQDAVRPIGLLGGEVAGVLPYDLPETDYTRCLVVVRKTRLPAEIKRFGTADNPLLAVFALHIVKADLHAGENSEDITEEVVQP